MKNSLKPLLVLLLLSQFPTLAFADDPTVYQSVEIEHAVIMPSESNDKSILKLFVRNVSSSNLTILGVSGPRKSEAEILARVENNKYSELGSITLKAGEGGDFTSSHMIFRLEESFNSLQVNKKLHLKLILSNGEIPFTAHIVER